MIAETCPVCKGSMFDGTGHSCWGWQPVTHSVEVQIVDGRSGEVILEMHDQGTAVARRDPWYVTWHAPVMGLLVCDIGTEEPVKVEMDEYAAVAALEAFGRADDPPLVLKRRVLSASFVPYERPEAMA